jgi:hypothetical protein
MLVSLFVVSIAGSGGLLECGALGCNHSQQFVPGFHKRFCAFVLKLHGQTVHINACLGKFGQNFFAIAPSAAMILPSSP